ncbi:alpha/beta hydrolase [Arthrobacter psychrolactophilus]
MATTLMRLRPQSFTVGVGLSGFVLHNELLATMEPLERQIPFLWAHDPADLVINPDATAFTQEWLRANTELSTARYAGMGHATSPAELADVSSFLTGRGPGSFVPSG